MNRYLYATFDLRLFFEKEPTINVPTGIFCLAAIKNCTYVNCLSHVQFAKRHHLTKRENTQRKLAFF